jgi:nucleoid DNA-binding protein
MKNVDCEIYISNFIQFFRSNPQDLSNLIGKADSENFFSEVQKQVYNNLKKGDELELTQKQLVDIIVKLNDIPTKDIEKKLELFLETPFGIVGLN